jgi:hypothetical protein
MIFQSLISNLQIMKRSYAGALGLAYLLLIVASSVARADVLQGGVQKEDELLRISRPQNSDLKIERPIPVAPPRLKSGVQDTTAFSPTLSGNARQDDPNLNASQPQYGTIPANKFDLGAERGDKELVLAWEKWHKQLSEAIYARWSQTASVPGMCTLRLTITRERHVQVQVLHASGNPIFDQGLIEAIQSLDSNQGLTFPTNSQRQFVSLESDYIAGHDINPGYSWVKNDYEKIHEGY